MLAAMLRQSTGGGSGGGGGTKSALGISRLSSSSSGSGPLSAGSWVPGRGSKSGSVGSDGLDVPASDPDYIMQLVGDVRKFADVLLQLKEVFNSKGAFGEGPGGPLWSRPAGAPMCERDATRPVTLFPLFPRDRLTLRLSRALLLCDACFRAT